MVGKEAIDKLLGSKIIVFGLGGVGSYTVTALARSGVLELGIVDMDTIELSNINRQLFALHSTIGKLKTEVCKDRINDINPTCNVDTYAFRYSADTMDKIDLSKYDYIVDAIDMVSSKILLIEQAQKLDIPIISCMGTGNKMNPSMLEVADIYDTSVCPLAKEIRKQLRAKGIEKLKVVYSKETPIVRGKVIASFIAVPATAGLILASEVLKDITYKEREYGKN